MSNHSLDKVSLDKTSTKNAETDPRPDSNLRFHLAGIIFLGFIMLYLLDSATEDEILNINSLLDIGEQEYDYFMANVDSIHYQANGRADYRFQAQRVTHYPNPEYSDIDQPSFLIYREDNTNWQVNSVSGRVDLDPDRNQERLVLNENVIINGVTADGTQVNIYTDTLTIYPEEKRLHSDSDVLFESDGMMSSSTGFNADLNTNVIHQLANGQMQYDN